MTTPTQPAVPARHSAATLLNFARGAKGLALLALLLPQITISCGAQEVVSWSGLDLATGRLAPPPPIPGMPQVEHIPFDPQPDLFLVGVASLILVGLIASVALPRRPAAAAALAASGGAAGLLCFDVLVRMPRVLDGALRAIVRELGWIGRYAADRLGATATVEPAYGFWLATGGLVAAFILCVMVLGRDRAGTGPPV